MACIGVIGVEKVNAEILNLRANKNPHNIKSDVFPTRIK
jgi:hypothetical protein